jgi:hypothetical protein
MPVSLALIETHSAGAQVPSYALYRAPAGDSLQMVVIFAGEAFSHEFQSPFLILDLAHVPREGDVTDFACNDRHSCGRQSLTPPICARCGAAA